MLSKITDVIVDYILNTDKLLWLFTLSASVYGLLLVYSMQRAGDYSYMKTQILAVAVGILGAVFISVIDYKYIVKTWWIWAGISLILTFTVFAFGIQVAGTDDIAWLRLPGGITFQPSEFTKICFIVTFSAHLNLLAQKGMLKTFLGFISLVIHAFVPAILIHMQGDDGSVLIFLLMFLIMTFASGVQLRYFVAMIVGFFIFIPLIWYNFLNDEHRNRILVLFSLDENAMNNYGWQQYQGKVSIASGGLSGYGLFNGSRVESGIVPEQENDFIMTVAGEELGFLGCILILVILFAIIIKSLANARTARDMLGSNICCGFFAMLLSQTIINIGMVLGLLPVIGITLPFFSAGGTSLMCLFLGIGLVQSVYIHRNTDLNDEKLHLNIKYKNNIYK